MYYVYIMGSISGTLYIGITNHLIKRVYEHKKGLIDGFSKKYKCKKLLYFEEYKHVQDAIKREKQLKNWRRFKKIGLINKKNSKWEDLKQS